MIVLTTPAEWDADEQAAHRDAALKSMQAFKARAVEHVRWRSLSVRNKDPLVEGIIRKMRMDIRECGWALSDCVWNHIDIGQSLTANELCQDLLIKSQDKLGDHGLEVERRNTSCQKRFLDDTSRQHKCQI